MIGPLIGQQKVSQSDKVLEKKPNERRVFSSYWAEGYCNANKGYCNAEGYCSAQTTTM